MQLFTETDLAFNLHFQHTYDSRLTGKPNPPFEITLIIKILHLLCISALERRGRTGIQIFVPHIQTSRNIFNMDRYIHTYISLHLQYMHVLVSLVGTLPLKRQTKKESRPVSLLLLRLSSNIYFDCVHTT